MKEAVRRATLHAVRPDERALPPVGAPGLVLGGKYRLEEAIARGGMARVWRATHVTLNRPVAVKFVESFGATADERIGRFLREAKVAASVRHKNVVDIIDFGTWNAQEPYMVMELLEGETLDQRLVRGSMGNDEVVSVALQMLSGLDAVHRAGIVHRDLKPGNVFLTDDHDGVFARLLDFGISQGADEEGSIDRVVVGTPEYMSPEQAFGDPLDARSDLYSVGIVLYEMLSGVLPFEDADPQKVVEMVAHGTLPDLEMLRPDVPELCRVVACATSRDPAARFGSARDMRRAILEAIGAGPDTTGRHSAVVRDSRVSGMHVRTVGGGADVSSVPPPTDVGSSPTAAELEPILRGSAPPPGGAGRAGRAGIVIGAVALVAVTAAIVWAAATLSNAPAAVDHAQTEELAPPPVVAPVPAPGVMPMPVVDAVAADGVAAVAADGVAGEPVAADGVAADGVAAEGVAVDGVAIEGAAPEVGEDDAQEPSVRAETAPAPARARSRRTPRAGGGIVRELDF